MRLSISNIAWDVVDDEKVADLLNANAIDAVDIAPSKYFSDVAAVSDHEIEAVRAWWATRGIEIVGMQSLLFGTVGLNLFNQDTQEAMLAHLKSVFRVAERMHTPRLVFGSPRNRNRYNLEDNVAKVMAIDFFQRAGELAHKHNVLLCLEPNPSRYNCNFMTNNDETAEIVTAVAQPSVRMQFDTGAIAINGEDPKGILDCYAGLIGHVHLSEPDLATLGSPQSGGADHSHIAAALIDKLPSMIATIETLPPKDGDSIAAIKKSIQIANQAYGSPA